MTDKKTPGSALLQHDMQHQRRAGCTDPAPDEGVTHQPFGDMLDSRSASLGGVLASGGAVARRVCIC